MAQKKLADDSRQMKVRNFDPNGIGHPNGNLFGLPFTPEESGVVIIPVPWDVTASSRFGTAYAPRMILKASYQVDFFDPAIPDAWKMGIGMLPISYEWQKRNGALRRKAKKITQHLERGGEAKDPRIHALLDEINTNSTALLLWVRETATKWLKAGKIVGVLGGDHSVPLGLMNTLGREYSYGVLHIGAHLDLRLSYEGFLHSHASIMRNASSISAIERFVHVAVRDFCEEEYEVVKNSNDRHIAFTDRDIKWRTFQGEPWQKISQEIIEKLPENVYVSFDIDGLDPSLCPATGTPVPGGIDIEQVFYLLSRVVGSKRKIIGFDLSEVGVGTGTLDANVGMRVLYRLACLAGKSQGKISSS